MCRPHRVWTLALVTATIVWAACRAAPDTPAAREVVTVARPIGSWQGTGGRMINLISDTGRLRIQWRTWNEQPPGAGRFRLTVESGISGRLLGVIVDRRGEGSGRADFEDDPRLYHVVVDSANVEWSVSVEELSRVYAGEPR